MFTAHKNVAQCTFKCSTRWCFLPNKVSHRSTCCDVSTVDVFLFIDEGQDTAPFMHLPKAEVWIDLELVQLRLTAWMFKVGSGQAWYLEVVHSGRRTLGCAPSVPLVQSVPGLRAQHPGRLLLLEVLDESHGSVRTGQVVTPWEVRRRGRKKHNRASYLEIKPSYHEVKTSSCVIEMNQNKNRHFPNKLLQL